MAARLLQKQKPTGTVPSPSSGNGVANDFLNMMSKLDNNRDPLQNIFRLTVLAMLALMFVVMQQQISTIRMEQRQVMGISSDMPNPVGLGSPLGIPQGKAKALPSIRVEKEEVDRKIYGGKGDKKHLGGFTIYDGHGVTPGTWKYMIQTLGVKSLMDVGCGKGVSTLWFHLHDVDVLCLEGSHDAVSNTLLPDPANQIVEHDFSRGPYWPEKTYDAVWCVEFLEHVGRNYQYNYIQAWRKSALIFASHSIWGGWHHVEVHDNEWWINRMESFGFRYSESLTNQIRDAARQEKNRGEVEGNIGPNGKAFNAQHIWLTMQVFINPAVASLPEHAHLFSTPGCYKETKDGGTIINRDCGTGKDQTESKLPAEFAPLRLTPDQDEAWLKRMKEHIASEEAKQKAAEA